PEVVIANWKPGPDARLLARFCLGIGVGLSFLMLAFYGLGVDLWWFTGVAKADPDVALGGHRAFLATALMPLLTAATSYAKGGLTAFRVTATRLWGSVASAVILAAVLWAGISLKWPGVLNAAAAVTLSQAAELAVLLGFLGARHRRIGEKNEPG